MQSDQKLIQSIKRKQNKEAANTLVSRYYREIYAYVYRQMGARETAEDITQEIFIKVLQGLHGYDEKKASFRTWLYKVASSQVTDYYRSKYHRTNQNQESMELLMETDEGVLNDNKEMKDLSELIVQRERIGEIMKVVSGYDREWILIFQKKCFEGSTFAMIAKEMDISENTVKARFYQMIKRIKQEVAE